MSHGRSLTFGRFLAICWVTWVISSQADARQVMQVVGPGGQVMTVPIQGSGGVIAMPPGVSAGETPPPADPDAAAAAPAPATPDANASEKSEAKSTVQREVSESEWGDKSELEVRPEDDGKISFSFRNQPWPALMNWLAEISEHPLDWQELPSDVVNLASPGRYTIAETRDLFNRHLLARGFTMLELDGGLTVVKTENINPAIVPRIDSSQLGSQMPYSYIKTSLDCGWLLAPKLAEEFKSMISSNGKLVALEQTNRLELMDAAINLQHIAHILEDEQSLDARSDLAREFELRHIPASEAKDMLGRFLGVEEKSAPANMSPEMMQQMQMMQQQMMQQAGGQAQPQGTGNRTISIVVNNRRNSLLVNAPPDRMAIAAQFIKQIDVPSSSIQSLEDIQQRVQVFRMTSLDPAKLVEIVSEMNILEPSTRMRVDDKNRALIVSASAADRYVIKSLIDRLDGSARKFEVLQLRRLDAQEVTESIMFLMGTEEKDDSNDNSRRYFYGYFGGSEEDNKKDKDKFRVAANVRYRQVLLWANESEMSEVRNLLIKLGELPPDGGNLNRIRRVEAAATPDTYEYLKMLKERFGELSPNPVVLPPAGDFLPEQIEGEEPVDGQPKRIIDAETKDSSEAAPEVKTTDEVAATMSDESESEISLYQFVRTQQDGSQSIGLEEQIPDVRSMQDFERMFGEDKSSADVNRANPNAGAPIRIELDDDGNLILLSDDVQALDRLENLMLDVRPPRRPYTVFKVQHASATWIALSLEDYFKDDEDKSDEDDSFLRFIWDMPPKDDEAGPNGLGRKRNLKFVSDNETGSIVVTGATTSDLKTIDELIKLWDVPESVSRRQSRYTRLVTIKYSRAERIAETIKDAYRDLLSSNDKAFTQAGVPQAGGDGGGAIAAGRGGQRGRDSGGSDLIDSEGGRTSGETSFQFRGKLSIGIDPVGNTLLVSAEGDDLLDLVCEMIDKLDQAARPQGGMQIRELPGSISVDSFETALRFISPNSNSNSRSKPSQQSAVGDTSPTSPSPAAPEPMGQ